MEKMSSYFPSGGKNAIKSSIKKISSQINPSSFDAFICLGMVVHQVPSTFHQILMENEEIDGRSRDR